MTWYVEWNKCVVTNINYIIHIFSKENYNEDEHEYDKAICKKNENKTYIVPKY